MVLRTIFVLIGVLALVAFTGPRPDRDTIRLVETDAGHMVAEVRLEDGRTIQAVIDTGATVALMDHAVLSPETYSVDQAFDTVDIVSLGGVETLPSVVMPNLYVSKTPLNDTLAGLIEGKPYLQADSVLPAQSFKYRTLDFHFPRRLLSLYDTRPRRPARRRLAREKIIDREGLWFIDVRLNGQKGLALVDTGSNASFLNGAFAEAAKLPVSQGHIVEIEGATSVETQGRRVNVRKLSVGGLSVHDFDITIVDPPLFEALGMSAEPILVIGMDFLQHIRMQVDQKKREIRFWY
ncbi:MAG: retropepsin-like aspartic protease [Pseudomonadota bacterium]